MKAMILAAGRGNRLRPITDQIPKPLLAVGNTTLIEKQILELANQGFSDIVINLAHLGSLIQQKLGDGKNYGVNIQYSVEEGIGLETGGGVFNALPLLGAEPFLVVSGDLWTDYPYHRLKKRLNSNLAHLVLVENPDYHREGDFCLSEQGLVNYQNEQKLTFASIGVYHPNLFLGCEPGYFRLRPLFDAAIAKNKVSGELYHGEWFNIGTIEDYQDLLAKDGIAASN